MTTHGNDPSMRRPAKDVTSWDEFFMGTAVLASFRSKDPGKRVGACIVNKARGIVGIGYNGMPLGCKDSHYSWNNDITCSAPGSSSTPDEIWMSSLYVCHAELNAILNVNSMELKGSTIYVLDFPCYECVKAIIQAEIAEVTYCFDTKKDTPTNIAAKTMLGDAKIKLRPYVPKNQAITIKFY